MTYKNLLIHLDDRASCKSRTAAAIALARSHSAHLTGLFVAVDPILPGSLRAEVPPEYLSMLGEQQEEAIEAGRKAFNDMVRAADVNTEFRSVRVSSSSIADAVALHARYADLVLLGQPESDVRGEYEAGTAEDVIMSSGRPGLVVPYIGAGKTIGRRPMVAWNGGREAARAINDAMPILENAERVSVIVVNPASGDHGEEPGADIALHLARHGIKVEAHHLEIRDMSAADAILSRIADQDIDVLVMGAYGHSRVREWVLGGVTRQILAQMTVPVLMSH